MDEPAPPENASSEQSRVAAVENTRKLFSGLRVVSLLTLLSRILGMVRDIGMATLFGNGPIMDSFSVAFKLPNLARRLLGEGALSTAFLPTFIRELENQGRASAWKLVTAVLFWLMLFSLLIVGVGEILLIYLSSLESASSEARLLYWLTGLLLPYLILVCMAAQVNATLHALNHFSIPAVLPAILNLFWMAGIWLVAPFFPEASDKITIICLAILAGGVLQLILPCLKLFSLGYRPRMDWQGGLTQIQTIAASMAPIVVGLSITQFNTLIDSVLAWGLARPEAVVGAGEVSAWEIFESGTASALYFGQRMYQFPLGVFGVALGTVLYPRLSRHAERQDGDLLRQDLLLGLQLVIGVGLPASLGLCLMADPLSSLLFQYGDFDVFDARQTAEMIRYYGVGVVAFMAVLILNRGFYAVGDTRTPVRIGVVIVICNLLLNLALIWWMKGKGLALATSLAAMIQSALSLWLIREKTGALDLRKLASTTLRAGFATLVMSVLIYLELQLLPVFDQFQYRLLRVLVPLVSAVLVYLYLAHVLGLTEIMTLMKSGKQTPEKTE
ncbi:murein biosynthesis integral membrane protein MurJ [Gimesia sp.]|uniref:murein biosynthesis integral membrane protein MurJ n=1 Tax=Gimesia sp. TaxID=2024833 RepID=UPI000C458CDB|nr:murein biosynthesis integral membrane protein MurJ [Gimesia sp.]MAX40066.1 murein biosynthesis integral membrane protein MurJ [Gimesia sp.]HBL42726.1 murein biosynthesis integral membrane protein MurJ [Planctomycetaceae bacterium]|tara:strand:+ start:5406 stop:7076 length:1671 start_codon:yes stop_codon:yes gene_type:complete